MVLLLVGVVVVLLLVLVTMLLLMAMLLLLLLLLQHLLALLLLEAQLLSRLLDRQKPVLLRRARRPRRLRSVHLLPLLLGLVLPHLLHILSRRNALAGRRGISLLLLPVPRVRIMRTVRAAMRDVRAVSAMRAVRVTFSSVGRRVGSVRG